MRPPAPGHAGYRNHVAAAVARLADLLDRWDNWDVDQALPPMERRLTQPPEGDRDAFAALHRELLVELQDLDASAHFARSYVPRGPTRRHAPWPLG